MPWTQDVQVEQDLIISRALIEIFSRQILVDNLAFRGGTALYKLYLEPVRYSEDIDLVQTQAGAIGPILDALHGTLDLWLGKPNRKQSEGRVTMAYRIRAEDGSSLKLKVEINSREHFNVFGLVKRPMEVKSRWFTGSATIQTFHLDELLGTKMRALYQRKKGRDLFDLWIAGKETEVNPERVVSSFRQYMEHEGHKVSRAEYEENLIKKLKNPLFAKDISPLLIADSDWNFQEAADFVMHELVARLPGEQWQGLRAMLEGSFQK
ncbi:MAG: nucleotidyl transferase AbiEii/AbiGii toxin family protein [Syntrophobacteraceae bacterium]